MSLAPRYWRCQHGAKCFIPCPDCPGPLVGFPSELQKALQEDGEKLRQLTGKDHGPFPDPTGDLVIQIIHDATKKIVRGFCSELKRVMGKENLVVPPDLANHLKEMDCWDPGFMVEDNNKFQCARCRQIYDKGWTDEEAAKELEQNFPGFSTGECALVCDDCVKEMTGGKR